MLIKQLHKTSKISVLSVRFHVLLNEQSISIFSFDKHKQNCLKFQTQFIYATLMYIKRRTHKQYI